MNLLTNICNPKQQHFEQQAKNQVYRPIDDYVFQNRNLQKIKARYQGVNSTQQFKYRGWNHPYSVSNVYLHQNNQRQRSFDVNQSFIPYQQDFNQRQQYGNRENKNYLNQIKSTFCGTGKKQEGQKTFESRGDFYSSIRKGDQFNSRNSFPLNGRNYDQYQQPNRSIQHIRRGTNQLFGQQNSYQSGGQPYPHSYSVLTKQILHLKNQNKQLKRIIQQQYKPMKELYNKLLSEQQERQYLITKLQWKVKQLVKEMSGYNGSADSGHFHNKQNSHKTKNQAKQTNRNGNQKYSVQAHQNTNNMEHNFKNIQIQNNKTNVQSYQQPHYQNTNIYLNQNVNHNQLNSQNYNQVNQRVSLASNSQQINTNYNHPSNIPQSNYIQNQRSISPQPVNFTTTNVTPIQSYSKPAQTYQPPSNYPTNQTYQITQNYQQIPAKSFQQPTTNFRY